MLHPSFRTTLLAGFLLIAGILGAAAASGWFVLERFSQASHQAGMQAVTLTTAVQQLAERTVDMERSARQFLVLRQATLLERFDAAQIEALRALSEVESSLPAAAIHAREWRALANATRSGLVRTEDRASGQIPPPSLSRFAALNDALAADVRFAVEQQQAGLLATLERGRERLTLQLTAALVAAIALGTAGGWWILRPLRHIERAIARLGDSRLDTPVLVGGPADLRRVGQQLDWLRQRLVTLQADRDRVMRHVSHELKTPLASLREGISLLRDGVVGPLSVAQQEIGTILEHNARLLQSRIEQLLDFNAIQFDATRLDRRPVDLRRLADRVADAQRLSARARAVEIEVSGNPQPAPADHDKLETALANILANAIAFAPAHSRIRLVLGNTPELVTIDCIDDGPGIPPEELERIFEPFFQGSIRAERPCKGTGLGLSIVRELIRAHGGRVHVLPAHRGAHFRLELPSEPTAVRR